MNLLVAAGATKQHLSHLRYVDIEAAKTATVPFQLTQTTQVMDLNRYDPIWSVMYMLLVIDK